MFGAIGAIGGDLLGSAAGGWFSAREASKNRSFQRDMSNTAYQRAADDLEAAGLNRILALGSPASTPSGAQGAMEAPALGTTGIAASSAKAAIRQQNAQTSLTRAQEKETEERTRLTSAEAEKQEVLKGLYKALGPQAEKLFQTLGSKAEDFSNLTADDITDTVRSAGQKLPGLIFEGAKAYGEGIRDQTTRRGGRLIENLYNSAKAWWRRVRENDQQRRQR